MEATQLDDQLVKHIEETIRQLRKESPNRITPKRALTMITLVATTVVALGGLVTYGVNVYTMYGWVTRQEFSQVMKVEDANFVSRADYLQDTTKRDVRNDRQDAEIKSAQDTSNEILAFVKIVPQLKVMLRIKCGGNMGVQPTIDELHTQFKNLTGREYIEPRCNDPELRSPSP